MQNVLPHKLVHHKTSKQRAVDMTRRNAPRAAAFGVRGMLLMALLPLVAASSEEPDAAGRYKARPRLKSALLSTLEPESAYITFNTSFNPNLPFEPLQRGRVRRG